MSFHGKSFSSKPAHNAFLQANVPCGQLTRKTWEASPSRAFREIVWPVGGRIFGFWRGFGEGACPQWPVTEPKRSQNPKRPLAFSLPTEWPHYFLNRSNKVHAIKSPFRF